MQRVVLDTSVLVAALRSRNGASSLILTRVAHQQLRPLVTTPLFLEYEAVLKRAEQQLATGLNTDQIDQFLSAFASAAEGVNAHFRWRPQLRDTADEMVLEVAVNGNADVLITHNVKDFTSVAKQFGFTLSTPGQYLQDNPDE